MSTLLNHVGIREVLRLIAIPSPEVHDFYLWLLSVYENNRGDILGPRDEIDSSEPKILSIKSYYPYTAIGGGIRRVNFSISNQHDLSQIFLFCIFMEKGVMSHQSTINIDSGTPKELIGIASDYLERLKHEQDELQF